MTNVIENFDEIVKIELNNPLKCKQKLHMIQHTNTNLLSTRSSGSFKKILKSKLLLDEKLSETLLRSCLKEFLSTFSGVL